MVAITFLAFAFFPLSVARRIFRDADGAYLIAGMRERGSRHESVIGDRVDADGRAIMWTYT